MSSTSQDRPWDVHRLPSAEGRNFLVTGGNAGIGYFVAEQLAATGAVVVLGSHMTDPTVAAHLWTACTELTAADPHLGFR